MGILMSILHFFQKRFNRKQVNTAKHLGSTKSLGRVVEIQHCPRGISGRVQLNQTGKDIVKKYKI